MKDIGIRNASADLSSLGISNYKNAFWNLPVEQLIEETIKRGQGVLSDTGAISVKTGEFTGRSPKDRFIVKDDLTEGSVDWGEINIPFEKKNFDSLYQQILNYFSDKDLFIKDAYACSDPNYRLNVRLVAEYPWSAHFVNNMFLRLTHEEVQSFEADWNILCAPGFYADPLKDGTRQHNFAIVNFSEQKIIIGGTGYTGEIKKGIFSVLNYILPKNHDVLAMHCSANSGKDGDTAVFFGLSGTGKTTLSADPKRFLIGDDEHGWSSNSVFNFEGGCYAKTIDLSEEKEPDIYNAIKHGAILENIVFKEHTRTPDYEDSTITQNTRVSYPIYHINNALEGSKGNIPKNIFFLTADAFGVLPPISKLDTGQAMYHFISGYTAKVAGTEEGIVEPVATFSACFGAPFLPLHPTFYAEMLGKKMEQYHVNLWLINTGWTGGPYGIGSRIKLKYTRAMITAALNGQLDHDDYSKVDIFKLNVPNICPGVPSEILNTKNTWDDKAAFDKKANDLASRFIKNFKGFENKASETIMAAAPELSQSVF